MSNTIGIFRLFAVAFLFIIWAARIVSIASVPDVESPIYNAAVSVSFVERVASKYVSDCMAYAWVQAYDNDTPTNATAITSAQFDNYYNNCLATAAKWIEGNLDYVKNVSFAAPVVRKDWNDWVAAGVVTIDFNFPLKKLGYSGDIVRSYPVSVTKELTVTPTGYVVVSSGRAQYRIVVENRITGEIDVNGLWPR